MLNHKFLVYQAEEIPVAVHQSSPLYVFVPSIIFQNCNKKIVYCSFQNQKRLNWYNFISFDGLSLIPSNGVRLSVLLELDLGTLFRPSEVLFCLGGTARLPNSWSDNCHIASFHVLLLLLFLLLVYPIPGSCLLHMKQAFIIAFDYLYDIYLCLLASFLWVLLKIWSFL